MAYFRIFILPTYISKTCPQCNYDFTVLPRDKRIQFCGHACFNLSRAKIREYINCANCDKSLLPKQVKFCSRSCSATFNNKIDPKRKKNEINCKHCDIIVTPISKSLYCSIECKEEFNNTRIALIKTNSQCSIIRHKNLLDDGTYNNTCKHCQIIFNSKSIRKYCDNCSNLYSHEGRAKYWFSVNIFKYPELFNLDEFNKIGFRSIINPYGYTRDHKVSVNEAIRNNYDPYYITHVMNCELMLWDENNRKNTKSSITYDELIKLVDEYEKRRI